MNHVSCPTSIVNAPVEVVWALLTHPAGWGGFYNVRIVGVDPAGTAVVGQTVFAEAGPKFLHLGLRFRFGEIDAANYKLGFDVQFPLGVTVREDLSCIPMGEQCRVNYHCGFGFPGGWRGAVLHFLMRRRLDAGPADSLDRLKREAERVYAGSRGAVQ
jgi:hypothetical protein